MVQVLEDKKKRLMDTLEYMYTSTGVETVQILKPPQL